jgi:hypothetical protein
MLNATADTLSGILRAVALQLAWKDSVGRHLQVLRATPKGIVKLEATALMMAGEMFHPNHASECFKACRTNGCPLRIIVDLHGLD